MILGTHNKQPRESRRMRVTYDKWLTSTEALVNVYVRFEVVATPPSDAPAAEALAAPWNLTPFAVASEVDSGSRAATIIVSGGDSYTDYRVTILATTDTGQIKEDEIMVSVLEVS